MFADVLRCIMKKIAWTLVLGKAEERQKCSIPVPGRTYAKTRRTYAKKCPIPVPGRTYAKIRRTYAKKYSVPVPGRTYVKIWHTYIRIWRTYAKIWRTYASSSQKPQSSALPDSVHFEDHNLSYRCPNHMEFVALES